MAIWSRMRALQPGGCQRRSCSIRLEADRNVIGDRSIVDIAEIPDHDRADDAEGEGGKQPALNAIQEVEIDSCGGVRVCRGGTTRKYADPFAACNSHPCLQPVLAETISRSWYYYRMQRTDDRESPDCGPRPLARAGTKRSRRFPPPSPRTSSRWRSSSGGWMSHTAHRAGRAGCAGLGPASTGRASSPAAVPALRTPGPPAPPKSASTRTLVAIMGGVERKGPWTPARHNQFFA